MEEDVHYDGMAPSMLPMIVAREEYERFKHLMNTLQRQDSLRREHAAEKKRLETEGGDNISQSEVLVGKIVAESKRMIERQREQDAPNGTVGKVITGMQLRRYWYWTFKKFYEPHTEFEVLFKFTESRQQWGGNYVIYCVGEYGTFYRTGTSTFKNREGQRISGHHQFDPNDLAEEYLSSELEKILGRLEAM